MGSVNGADRVLAPDRLGCTTLGRSQVTDEHLREEPLRVTEGAQVQEGQGSAGLGAREEFTV